MIKIVSICCMLVCWHLIGRSPHRKKNPNLPSITTYWATDDGVTQGEVEIDLGKEKMFNQIVLQECIALGQRIEEFTLDVMVDGNWQELIKGTTIGYKRILRVDDMSARRLRLRIGKSMACPVLSEFGLYRAPSGKDDG